MTEAAEMLQLPEALRSEWSLRGYYGTVNHDVKAAIDKQFGWYSGNPATLHPLPRVEAAKKYVAYMGGADAIVQKAKADFANGDYRWVMQVLMQVVYADPATWRHATSWRMPASSSATSRRRAPGGAGT
jgi:alkyl sulfatase BDS1-like metallo-beta-lactamase superfamily hydrolase